MAVNKLRAEVYVSSRYQTKDILRPGPRSSSGLSRNERSSLFYHLYTTQVETLKLDLGLYVETRDFLTRFHFLIRLRIPAVHK